MDAQDHVALAKLPHLNGTINESMRLLPAILTQSSRVTPPEGLTVEGTFIPGDVKVCAPRYSIGRCTLLPLSSAHRLLQQKKIARGEILIWRAYSGVRLRPTARLHP